MSSYLLLRNNKESGPFTIEEIQGISLKAYDLIWVVGKSAAWRYPGEIPDLKSFAPPVPEQLTDRFIRKPDIKKSDSVNSTFTDSPKIKISEPAAVRGRENNGHKITSGRSVYVNLPTDKKVTPKHPDRVMFELEIPTAEQQEPAYDFSNLHKKRVARASRFSGKVLWVSTFFLLFGTGILTGFFISDRRIFFSTAEKSTHKQELVHPAILPGSGEISSPDIISAQKGNPRSNSFQDSAKMAGLSAAKSANAQEKRRVKIKNERKDSVLNNPVASATIPIYDSLKQSSLPKIDLLFQQIMAHPENYVSLQTGRYSTGVFGGISSFPITLTNNSSIVLNLVVSIDYIQNNEKIFKTESLSFDNLEPGESASLKAPKSPRGVKINTHMHVLPHQAAPGTSN